MNKLSTHTATKDSSASRQTKYKIPFLLSILLYSLAIVTLLCIVALTLAVLTHLSQFKALSTFFKSTFFASSLDWYVYIPLAFLYLALYSIVQMIRRQGHALILFLILSAALFIFLLFQQPVDKSNLSIVGGIGLLVAIHTPWFVSHKQPPQASKESKESHSKQDEKS